MVGLLFSGMVVVLEGVLDPLKSELWASVKRGDFVIYADEYEGVFRAKIVELDIALKTVGKVTEITYPYGKTAETGTVRIQYDSKQLITNLRDLIEHSPARLWSLQQAWEKWQTEKSEADELRAEFLKLASELKG